MFSGPSLLPLVRCRARGGHPRGLQMAATPVFRLNKRAGTINAATAFLIAFTRGDGETWAVRGETKKIDRKDSQKRNNKRKLIYYSVRPWRRNKDTVPLQQNGPKGLQWTVCCGTLSSVGRGPLRRCPRPDGTCKYSLGCVCSRISRQLGAFPGLNPRESLCPRLSDALTRGIIGLDRELYGLVKMNGWRFGWYLDRFVRDRQSLSSPAEGNATARKGAPSSPSAWMQSRIRSGKKKLGRKLTPPPAVKSNPNYSQTFKSDEVTKKPTKLH